jgi:acetolactate synthase-1/2/3 large subunit
VFSISGDGSIQMNIQELATTIENNIPVKVVILNNRYLGMVRQWQELFYQERYSSVDLGSTPDFVKLAEAYGAIGLRANRPSEVEAVLKEGLKARKTVFMDFITARYEKVFPMVPAGASINEMIFGEEKKREEKKLKAVK